MSNTLGVYNHCMPSQTESPLVSFCLFAYNQESYIREAVLGALSQTYSPLEIILSDDCSSDRTFEVIQEVSAAYQGPHRIKVLRNQSNLGLIGHVNKLFEMAEGELLVLAAGDDVSLPGRTQAVVSAWREDPRVDAFCSAYTQIADDGTVKGVRVFDSFTPSPQWLMTQKTTWFGCGDAYTKRLFTFFGPIVYNTTEDVVYYRRALLLGGVRYINEPLVNYRIGCGISTRKLPRAEKVRIRNEWRCSLALQMLSDLAKLEPTPFLLKVARWWCRNLEGHLLFRSVLMEKGYSRLGAYLLFLWCCPLKALSKMDSLFPS